MRSSTVVLNNLSVHMLNRASRPTLLRTFAANNCTKLRWLSTDATSSKATLSNNPFGDERKCDPHGFPMFEVGFLGTGTCPSKYRSPSSTVLYFAKQTWMFDVGDGTLRQTCMGEYNYGSISKIFISRMAANHLFGLPALLVSCCIIENQDPLHIYGPPGIYSYICASMSAADVKNIRPIVVHELCFESHDLEKLPAAFFPWAKDKQSHYLYKSMDPLPSKNISVKKIYSTPENGYWKIIDDPGVTVLAGLVGMVQPTFGFIVKEVEKSGILKTEMIKKYNLSIENLAELKKGHDVTTESGSTIKASEVVSKNLPGRKVCIISCGSKSSHLVSAAQDCDILVHEATNSNERTRVAALTGHSTPQIAVAAAKEFNAKRLILSSIGSKFYPTVNKKLPLGAEILLRQAKEGFDRPNHIAIAHDFMNISIPKGGFDYDPEHTISNYIRSFKTPPSSESFSRKKATQRNEIEEAAK